MVNPVRPVTAPYGFAKSRSAKLSVQNVLNWYVKPSTTPTFGPESLYARPGLKEEIASPTSNGRTRACQGGHTMAEEPYFVLGGSLYRVDESGTDFVLSFLTSTIENTGTRVLFADNGNQLAVCVPGVQLRVYNRSTGLTSSDLTPSLPGNIIPGSLTFVDQYLVISEFNGDNVVHSDLNDFTAYTGTSIAQAEADPDDVVAVITYRGQLHVFGSSTIQPYTNVGASAFAFAAQVNAVLPIGLVSRYAIVKVQDGIFFFGQGPESPLGMYLYTGSFPQKVSNEELDTLLSGTTIAQRNESYCFQYTDRGEQFAGITIAGRTYVYQINASRLLSRLVIIEYSSVYNPNIYVSGVLSEISPDRKGEKVAWRANAFASGYGQIFAGDSFDGRINMLDKDTGNELGKNIVREVTLPPYYIGPQTVSSIEFITDTTPTNMEFGMSWSNNGTEFVDPIYKIIQGNNYDGRTRFRRLGRFPLSRTIRAHFSGDYPLTMLGVGL